MCKITVLPLLQQQHADSFFSLDYNELNATQLTSANQQTPIFIGYRLLAYHDQVKRTHKHTHTYLHAIIMLQ